MHEALEYVEIRLVDERFENHDDGHEKLLFAVRETDRHVAVAKTSKKGESGKKDMSSEED